MSNKISEYRKKLNLTQPQLAEKANLTNYTLVQRYERERRTPNVYIALRIAKALNATVEEVFPLEDEPTDKQD